MKVSVEQMTAMKWTLTFLFLGLHVVPNVGFARPISGAAVAPCEFLASLAKLPADQRILTPMQTREYIALAQSDDGDVRLCAVLVLAHARDGASKEVLTRLSQERRGSGVKVAAAYALKLRDLHGVKPDERLRSLFFYLGRSDAAYERAFLANRIFVDFGQQALPTLLIAAKMERDSQVKGDMLYYLSRSTNPIILEEILTMDWGNEHELAESMAFLMRSLTPGRPKGLRGTSVSMILQDVRARIGK